VRDVAAPLVGVPVGTVANVLNRLEKVSDQMVECVHRAISNLGFVHNDAGRHLRATRSLEWADSLSATGTGDHRALALGHRGADARVAASLFSIQDREVTLRQAERDIPRPSNRRHIP